MTDQISWLCNRCGDAIQGTPIMVNQLSYHADCEPLYLNPNDPEEVPSDELLARYAQ